MFFGGLPSLKTSEKNLAITIDESTGKVFYSVGSLAQSHWSLKHRKFSFGKAINPLGLI